MVLAVKKLHNVHCNMHLKGMTHWIFFVNANRPPIFLLVPKIHKTCMRRFCDDFRLEPSNAYDFYELYAKNQLLRLGYKLT